MSNAQHAASLSNLTTLLSLVSVTLATPTTSTFPRLSSHCTDPQLEKPFGLPLPVQTVSLLSRDVLAVCASRPLETGNVSSVLHDMCVGPLTRVSRSQQRHFSGEPVRITCWVNSEWVGHHVSSRACSGGLLALSDAVITSWARMQATASLSSSEAELYAIGSGFVETISSNTFWTSSATTYGPKCAQTAKSLDLWSSLKDSAR